MTKHYFTSSIAPITYGAFFLPFTVEETLDLLPQWANDPTMKPFHDHGFNQGDMETHITKVSATREELPSLLKPQNYICRYVIVPTKSKWTAILSPHCIHRLIGFTKTSMNLETLGLWMAHRLGTPKHSPCSVTVIAEPRRHTTEHQSILSNEQTSRGVRIFSTGEFEEGTQYGKGISRLIESYSGESVEIRSWNTAPLSSFGLTDAPEIDVDYRSKDDLTDEEMDHLWENFNFNHIDHICQQLGLHVFDDAFYGTTGYLIEPWYDKYEYFHIEDRIPFTKYQQFCRLTTDGIRAWTSNPNRTDLVHETAQK